MTARCGSISTVLRMTRRCAVVGRHGLDRRAASTSQMGRFETVWLASEANLTALTDLSGAWIDRVNVRKPQTTIAPAR